MACSDYDFEYIHCYEKGCLSYIKNKMVNSVDPDETARYEPSHLELHCLQNYLFWSAEFQVLK